MITNKLKIFNDPIYGFISVPDHLIFDIIQHPYFQRLRRISQMGLSYLVYPGAHHTRFHHALGAMHLMQKSVETLRSKGVDISHDESMGLYLAILLHDMGHGPFSHALEHSIVPQFKHETLSLWFMEALNLEYQGALDTAIAIFTGQHPKTWLTQLISGQFDMDRLDYLRRDSFYTGVAEGQINADRLIQMLQVVDGQLVLEEKGIYSVEKFLMARRMMYWQAYLHKTSLVAEMMLSHVLQRAKELVQKGKDIPLTGALSFFMRLPKDAALEPSEVIPRFSLLDDTDVICALKSWIDQSDFVLSTLSRMILHRDLLRIQMSPDKFAPTDIDRLMAQTQEKYNISASEAHYFVFKGKIKNQAYDKVGTPIRILRKDGLVEDVVEASDQMNLKALAKPVTKYYLCSPKDL